MKKILAIVFIIICLGGCSNNAASDSPADTPVKIPYEFSDYYEIYDITKYNKPQFQWFIFDNEHEVLDYGVEKRMEPFISKTDGLIKFYISLGTSADIVRYYEPENKIISDGFNDPIAQFKTKIVYLDTSDSKKYLVVQDVFDKTKYYRTFQRDFYIMPHSISAEFINNGRQLSITYETEEDRREVTEILDLT